MMLSHELEPKHAKTVFQAASRRVILAVQGPETNVHFVQPL